MQFKYAAFAVVPFGVYLFRRYVAGGIVPERLYQSSDPKKERLEGQTAIVTGGNTGIGFETVQKLAQLGAKVILATRDEKKAKEAIAKMKRNENIEFIRLDLADLKTIKEFTNEIEKRKYQINILINNAAVMMCPNAITKDGFEIQFQTNHLAHFLLVQLLFPNLKRNKARIVNVSSLASERGQLRTESLKTDGSPRTPQALYSQSKLCNVLFTNELARRYGYDITTYSLHPGVINTELARHVGPMAIVKSIGFFLFKTPFQGAQTSLFAALCDKNEVRNGSYLADCVLKYNPNPLSHDEDLGKKLWDISEEYVAKYK